MKLKILFIDYRENKIGGGQVSLFLLLKNINRKTFDISLFMSCKNEFLDWLENVNINYKIVPLFNLFKAIKEESPDIIHCNAAAVKYTFVSALYAKLLKIPFIWHVRIIEEGGWRDKIISKLSAKIITNSKAVRDKKFKDVTESKLQIIHNAVDTNKFKPDLNIKYLYEELLISQNIKVIGLFSRLIAWKGHKLFFEMAKLLTDKFENVKFLIVGDGEDNYKNELEKYCKSLELTQYTIFLGFRSDVPELMSLCDVIVNSSIEPEAFGRTIIEAMALRKPVVSTNIGGPNEIIENGVDGFLVSPDKNEMKEKIIQLLDNDKLRDKVSNAALHKVQSSFSIDSHIKKIEKLYKELLK